jgi:two-component system cell cycle sensor histidine kinase/response regulator CckA
MSGSMTDHPATPVQLDTAFFRRLFDGAGLPIFTCDREGNILAWNPLGESLLADWRGSPRRPNLRDILPAEHHRDLEENLRTLVEAREPLEFRARVRLAGGEMTEYAVWLTPVCDDQNRLEHVCVWFHDITARLQLRRGLRKRERLTTLGVLAGSVAHHYNNLLCSITTSLEFALNMNTMSAMRRVLRRTADAVGRTTRLTQQLLAFAQADHRMQDLADLTETVLQYFDQHEADLATRGIKLELHWERVPFVPLPREQLNIVIDNLVRNAAEAMPNGGVLSAALRRRDENSVIFAIADSGPGISAESMEHIFEPFFTTKGELAAGEDRRAGMGLAVVHGLVGEMHGSISISTAPTGGARFEIILPLNPDQ